MQKAMAIQRYIWAALDTLDTFKLDENISSDIRTMLNRVDVQLRRTVTKVYETTVRHVALGSNLAVDVYSLGNVCREADNQLDVLDYVVSVTRDFIRILRDTAAWAVWLKSANSIISQMEKN